MADETTNKPAPFLKWAGGKRAVLPQILPRIPASFNAYFEPFVGGGAVFFELQSQGLLQQATISDYNQEMMSTYQEIQDEPAELIKALRQHQINHEKSSPWQTIIDPKTGEEKQGKDGNGYYYQVRAQTPTSQLEKAARMIYLNRTCFNGLYRVNSSGGFNVPAGKYKNPDVVQEDRLWADHKALQGVTLLSGDYQQINPSAGDFVYLDPPYDVWNATSFTKYAEGDFGWEDQEKLVEFAVQLRDKNQAQVMLSNHATERILELYTEAGFHAHCFPVGRPVASKAENRKAVTEVLFTSYPSGEYAKS